MAISALSATPVLPAVPAPDTRAPEQAAVAVRLLLEAGFGDLPRPGRGETATRFAALRAAARWDVVAGRLVEAHTDAVAILADLEPGGPGAGPGQWWAVWAAEPPGGAAVTASPPLDGGDRWTLSGRKPWCSGAGLASHALVTAVTADGGRHLFAVVLDQPGVRVVPGGWQSAGMAGSDTRSVDLQDVLARPVGGDHAYLDRPGFWHGAVGVSACWLGGAEAVLDRLFQAVRAHAGIGPDPHAAAHLGACVAAVHAAGAELEAAAAAVDADPDDVTGVARLVALRARAVVERAASEVLDRVGRALGPAPLAIEADHARRVADLQIYLRQSHAERDLATLGELALAAADAALDRSRADGLS
jgi:alkylation response protein AidB-like acyl-CoA dehydrogenase